MQYLSLSLWKTRNCQSQRPSNKTHLLTSSQIWSHSSHKQLKNVTKSNSDFTTIRFNWINIINIMFIRDQVQKHYSKRRETLYRGVSRCFLIGWPKKTHKEKWHIWNEVNKLNYVTFTFKNLFGYKKLYIND